MAVSQNAYSNIRRGSSRLLVAITLIATGVFSDLAQAELPESKPGVWTNITPADFDLKEFGSQSVCADPARHGEFYFLGNGGQGVWKSTDFGNHWTHITPSGFIYYMTIDPNPKRNPSVPPTLWACAGYGIGIARSSDGGKTWSKHKVNNAVVAASDAARANDTYYIEVDPTNSKHLLTTIHGSPGISESHDRGDTWTTIKAADASLGVSLYVFFTDPSPAEAKAGATISSTWLSIAQGGSGGVFRTCDGGKTFQQVEKLQHGHGNAQMFMAGHGVVYMAGCDGSKGNGIYRSKDYGVTWEQVGSGAPQDGVYGTKKFIYADFGWATASGQPQHLERSPRDQGTRGTWTNYFPNPPMSNGSGHAVVSYDGSHAVIISANWKAGIWRYIEP